MADVNERSAEDKEP